MGLNNGPGTGFGPSGVGGPWPAGFRAPRGPAANLATPRYACLALAWHLPRVAQRGWEWGCRSLIAPPRDSCAIAGASFVRGDKKE